MLYAAGQPSVRAQILDKACQEDIEMLKLG